MMIAKVIFYPSNRTKRIYGEQWSSIKMRIQRHLYTSGSKDYNVVDWAPIDRRTGEPQKWASQLIKEIKTMLPFVVKRKGGKS